MHQTGLIYNNTNNQTQPKIAQTHNYFYSIAYFLAPTNDTNLVVNYTHKGGRKWRKQLIKLKAKRRENKKNAVSLFLYKYTHMAIVAREINIWIRL